MMSVLCTPQLSPWSLPLSKHMSSVYMQIGRMGWDLNLGPWGPEYSRLLSGPGCLPWRRHRNPGPPVFWGSQPWEEAGEEAGEEGEEQGGVSSSSCEDILVPHESLNKQCLTFPTPTSLSQYSV